MVEIWHALRVLIVVTNSVENIYKYIYIYIYVCVSGVVGYYGFLEYDAASLGELFLTFCGNIVPCEFRCQTVREEWHSNLTTA